MTIHAGFRLFRTAFRSWNEDKAMRMAAAISFYTVLSMPPLLVFVIGVAGLIFDRAAVQGRIVETLQTLVGPNGARGIQDILTNTQAMRHGVAASLVGLVTLFLSAAAVFAELKDALNTVWEIEPRPGRRWSAILRKYFVPILILLGTGFLLMVSLVASAVLAAIGDLLTRSLPGSDVLWQGVNFLLSLAVIAGLFALMFKRIPDGTVCWKDALVGGVATSILFTIGEHLIGIYLGSSNIGSAFGAAGSLVVLLLWVYYSASIFLYGAELTRAYAMRYGEKIELDPDARPVTETARKQQGIPHHGKKRPGVK